MSAENVTLMSHKEQLNCFKTLCAYRHDLNEHAHVCLHGSIESKLFNGISVLMP